MADSSHEASLLRLTDLVAFFQKRFEFVISRQLRPVFGIERLSSFAFKKLLRKTPVMANVTLTQHTFEYGVSMFGKLGEHRLQLVT